MNTRKTILSAMSIMASMMMFVAGSSDTKGETQAQAETAPVVQTSDSSAKRTENQAIVAGLKTDLKPSTRKHEVDPALAAEQDRMFLEAVRRYEEEQAKKHQKSKGMPLSVYVLCGLAAMASGMAAGSIGAKVGLALRKKREGRTG